MSPSGIIRFGWLFLTHPLLIWPTWIATKRTFSICNELYGKSHHKSNKANAFRHAFWNLLICQKTLKKTKNAKKSADFTQKVTDLYEKATKNEEMDQAMDFHNNAIGRSLFLDFFDQNESELVNLVQKKAEKAQKVAKFEEIEQYKNELVYISE
ncbi:hypothetical protein POV27_00100 [Aureisphaera galaxeae]|uniref:DUF6973 domain-containing protein n=1 Tax=Aureisphaera galaxeae TaxID=1538023 RepID=UPI00234FBEDE|nr:hypothetical protein [Aureisphaera galaxeae]MDC8002437.1 hypothetical protein [Aureisphaera galaxeae]